MTESGLPITTALRCFTCGYTNADDHLCIDDPISVQGQSIVTCSKKYCTIQRQELQTPAGKVQSFLRDCQEVPPVSYRSIIITPFTEKLHKNIYNWHNVLVFIAIVSNVIVSLSLSFLSIIFSILVFFVFRFWMELSRMTHSRPFIGRAQRICAIRVI